MQQEAEMKKNWFGYRSTFVAAVLAVTMLFSGCGKGAEPDVSEATLQAYMNQIMELQAENEELKNRLQQYEPEIAEETGTENPEAENTGNETASAETAPAEETQQQPAVSENGGEEQASNEEGEKPQIVVFGDSIWDSARDDSGIGAQVAKYMNADVYNCAIGGTRASIPAGDEENNYENWTSSSLIGMINIMMGRVEPDFLGDSMAASIIRQVDFSKVDYFILAYGVNDYLSGAQLNAERLFDPHTYGGALRYAIETIKTNFPNAKILVVSPHYCRFFKDGFMYTDGNLRNTGYGTLYDYSKVAGNVAETTQTLFIDAYVTMGIDGYTADDYLEDGVHLTAAGRELYAKAVSSCLKYGKPGEVSGNSIYY